jgi:uncharacterized protein YbjT (DUF2867 family)
MANWDFGRFLNTVSYFDAVPIFSDLRRFFAGESDRKFTIAGERTLGLILVIGATSEIGRSIVDGLLKAGYKVRAIVADLDSTRSSLPAGVEFVKAELDGHILTSEVMQGVKSIVYCCGNPQSNLAVEDLSNLAKAAKIHLPEPSRASIFDFTRSNPHLQSIWGSVDDVVMGGVSESGMRWGGSSAIFSGRVSTDNSGGFASVRTRNFDPTMDLTDYTGIELRVKGDGQRYKIFIRTEAAWDGVGYAYSFDTSSNEWMTIQVPFDRLVPVFRAKVVNPSPRFDRTQIRSFQLMLSKFEYDRELNPSFTPGLFTLEIESIAAYGAAILPQLAIVADPTQDLSGTILSADSIALLAATSLPYTIIRPGNMDVGSLADSLQSVIATMTVKSLSQPTAVGKTLTFIDIS